MSGSVSGVVTALIAGGFAVVGFGASSWQNSRTIRANRIMAQEQRIWDRKAALYESIYAQVAALDALEGPASADGLRQIWNALGLLRPAVMLYGTDRVSAACASLSRGLRMAVSALEEREADPEAFDRKSLALPDFMRHVREPSDVLRDAMREDIQPEGSSYKSHWDRPR